MKSVWLAIALGCVLAMGCAKEEAVPAETAEGAAAEVGTVSGATSTVAQTEARRNPCDFITEAEASEALGQPSKYRSYPDDGSSNCIIDPVKENEGLSVDFKVTDDPYAWTYESSNSSAERVEGLGDEAVWNPVMSSLAIKKGDQAFIGMFSYMMVDEPDMKGKAIAFGRKVAEKM